MSKTHLSLLAGVAMIVAAVSFTIPSAEGEQAVAPGAGDLPIGLRCIITLDPSADGDSKQGSEALKMTGLTAEDTVEGAMVSMGVDWVVLKDGTYENWIPRDKVLFMRVSR